MKTRNILSMLFSILIIQSYFGQSSLNATLNSFKRPTPLIGFNAQASFSTATWTLQSWRDSVATLNSGILRYPGGSNSNYFDWQTGASMNSACTPTWVANLQNTVAVKAEHFQLGLNACAAKALMVLNFQCSNINYQLQGLNYALSKGVPINYLEIGNEHNIYQSVEQYIPASIYAPGAKTWADSLKAHYPNAKVCLVGGAGSHPLTTGWLDSIFSKNPNIDALSFHVYLPAGNSDNKFFARRALSMPFNTASGGTGGLISRYAASKFNSSVVPSNIEVWATEFNLSEQIYGNPIQHAGTWTHGLYVSEMAHLLMTQPKVTMLLNHNVTGLKDFAAVDINKQVTANGVAMKLLGEMAKGTDSTQLLDFNGQANITWSTTTYPSLIGWKFWKGNNQYGWVCNLSQNAIKVSFNQIISGTIKYDNYYADTASFVQGIKSLNHISGNTSDSISLPPFSITTMLSQSNTSIISYPKLVKDLLVYPNPSNGTINIGLNNEELKRLKILDVLGREISYDIIQKNWNGLSVKLNEETGFYFLIIETSQRIYKEKILIQN